MHIDFGTFPTKLTLVAFDLDNTLAPSKTELPTEMAQAMIKLLNKFDVAVISGADFPQFENQLIQPLFKDINRKEKHNLARRLHLLPTCGTQYFRFKDDKFQSIYCHEINPKRRAETIQIIEKTAKDLGLWETKTWGKIIEDRRAQVTFSALGQSAPLNVKYEWDQNGEKKALLRDALAPLLPDLEVRSGGSTSIDVTLKGIDKSYGMKQLMQYTKLDTSQILFIADRLDKKGNDYPVISTGIACKAVTCWQDTIKLINMLAD